MATRCRGTAVELSTTRAIGFVRLSELRPGILSHRRQMNSPAIETNPLMPLPETGIQLLRQTFDRELVRRCEKTAEQFYQRTQSQSPELIQQSLPAGQKHVPIASSFTLEAVFASEDCRRILQAIAASPVRDLMERTLAGPPLCDLDQSWVRRQYAPGRYPPLHAPHAWHQDGALGYDFRDQSPTAPNQNSLLRMLTCWLPLVPCGDYAPGLEFVTVLYDNLLMPNALTDQSIRSTYAAEQFWKPLMQPGDIVLFQGGVLHRTHVTPAMQSDRTSIELRFVAANRIPPRLAQDRFLPLD